MADSERLASAFRDEEYLRATVYGLHQQREVSVTVGRLLRLLRKLELLRDQLAFTTKSLEDANRLIRCHESIMSVGQLEESRRRFEEGDCA